MCILADKITFNSPYKDDIEERKDNLELLQQYIIATKDRKKIISNLKANNFCFEQAETVKDGKKYGNLFIFGVEKKLVSRETGLKEIVPIYIKFQFFDLNDCKDAVLVVSFHKAKKELRYSTLI